MALPDLTPGSLSDLNEKPSPAALLATGAGAAALPALRRLLAGLFEIAELDPVEASNRVECVAHASAQFILSDIRAPALRLARSALVGGGAAIDGFGLRLQLSGSAEGVAGDRDVTLAPGDLLFFDLQQNLELHSVAGPDGARDLCLWLPRQRMLAAVMRDDILHGLVLSGDSPAGALVGGSLRILAEQMENLSAQEMDALCGGLIALVAKALGSALAAPRASIMSPAAAFVTIRRYIDAHLHLPTLDVDGLSAVFGVSRASLYRLFEPTGGVASYIRRARLSRAFQEIAASETSGRQIGPIVYALGFKNVSAFNRLFKETYGVSPGEARKMARPGFGTALREPTTEIGTLAIWLSDMGKLHAAPAPRAPAMRDPRQRAAQEAEGRSHASPMG